MIVLIIPKEILIYREICQHIRQRHKKDIAINIFTLEALAEIDAPGLRSLIIESATIISTRIFLLLLVVILEDIAQFQGC